MAHHAYVYTGDLNAGIAAARAYAETELALTGTDNPNVAVFEYGLFSVDDARRVASFASQSQATGDRKLVVIATGRLFHEAQNALLKLFEEPVEGTTLVLVVPADGILLPTLRSRLIALPNASEEGSVGEAAEAFLRASKAEREKYATKLVARSKSDKDAEKQAARLEAVSVVAGITRAAYKATRAGKGGKELDLLLSDLNRLAPLMHERSASLKLIFEHLVLVMPEGLGK